jgi:dTDP-L-rhamnose 4-epimerase
MGKSMKVLITGGAGFIGSNLALKLVSKGYEVVVLDNLSPQIHGDNAFENSSLFLSIKDKVEFHHSCVTNRALLERIIPEIDCIVHLAAETGTGQSMYEIERYTKVNSLGTAIILNIIANNKCKLTKFIVASSRAIYGEGRYWSEKYNTYVYPEARNEDNLIQGGFEVKYDDDDNLKLVGTDESSKIHPTSVYGISKQNQEDMVLRVCHSLNIPAIALRYQNVYGPGQSLKNPYTGILSIFSTLILNQKPINIFEDGLESRDFIHIDDVVDATILSIETNSIGSKSYNVGTGIPTTVITVVKNLLNNYESDVQYKITGNFRIGDIRHNYADLEQIKKELGFKPKITFENGIKTFTDWVKGEKVESALNYQVSLNEMKSKGLFK